jgi:hypothetical protein
MATLLELCVDAVEGIDGFSSPSTIIGNAEPTAVLLKSVATQVGRELIREIKWQALQTDYSFATVALTSAYSLPTDFQRFANLTFWNESESRPLLGPLNARDWATLTRGFLIAGIRYSFSISGNYLRITPTPTAVQTIGYDYYSKYFCTDSGGTAIPNWAADTDLWRLDPDLAVLGMRYYFRSRKGLPADDERQSWISAVAALKYDDTPKGIIDVSGLSRGIYDGVPEGSFG